MEEDEPQPRRLNVFEQLDAWDQEDQLNASKEEVNKSFDDEVNALVNDFTSKIEITEDMKKIGIPFFEMDRDSNMTILQRKQAKALANCEKAAKKLAQDTKFLIKSMVEASIYNNLITARENAADKIRQRRLILKEAKKKFDEDLRRKKLELNANKMSGFRMSDMMSNQSMPNIVGKTVEVIQQGGGLSTDELRDRAIRVLSNLGIDPRTINIEKFVDGDDPAASDRSEAFDISNKMAQFKVSGPIREVNEDDDNRTIPGNLSGHREVRVAKKLPKIPQQPQGHRIPEWDSY